MNNSNNIIWIASYPKSGNTWVRCFLSFYQHKRLYPKIDINDIGLNSSGFDAEAFVSQTMISPFDISCEEVDILRPKVYSGLSKEGDELKFIKVHDGFRYNNVDEPIYGGNGVKGVIYIVRNPIDVLLSFSHHIGNKDSKSKALQYINEGYTYSLSTRIKENVLHEKVLPWKQHVMSWKNSPLKKIIVRYEDMKEFPDATFKKILSFCGISYTEEAFKESLIASNIEAFQKQEKINSFKELRPNQKAFFRSGNIREGYTNLSRHEKELIIENNEDVMCDFEYSTEL